MYAVAQAVARRVAKEAPEAPADVLRFDPTHFWGLVYGDRDEKRGDEDYRDDAKKPSRDGDGDGDGGGDGDDGFPRDERRPMGSSALSFGPRRPATPIVALRRPAFARGACPATSIDPSDGR